MNQQSDRTLQQTTTTLGPAEVLTAAKLFFARRMGIYAAYPEKEGPTFVALRGQGGEEVIIGVAPADGGTAVNGSTYMFDQQVARFFSTLPPARPGSAGSGPADAAAGAASAADGGPTGGGAGSAADVS